MTDLELNILKDIITSSALTVNNKKLLKGRWYKIYNKIFTNSFGIEIEIPRDKFKLAHNGQYIAKAEREIMDSASSYLTFLRNHKYEIKNPYAVCDLGDDCGAKEFRMFVTADSLNLLDKSLCILEKNCDKTKKAILNLHIHIPINKDFKFTISNVEKIELKYKEYFISILSYLIYDWKPKTIKKEIDIRYPLGNIKLNFFERLIQIKKKFHSFTNNDKEETLNNVINRFLPVRINLKYNTIEYRSMNTELTFESVMKNVFMVSLLHNAWFHGNSNEYLLKNFKDFVN